MTVIELPEGWSTPKFQLGQTVYITGTDNQRFTVMGLSYTTRGRFESPFWYYQMSHRPEYSILNVFEAYHGRDIPEDEISAEPWLIEGQVCDGVQHPCGQPAAYCTPQWDGGDFETRRAVDLFYCPACWAEVCAMEAA